MAFPEIDPSKLSPPTPEECMHVTRDAKDVFGVLRSVFSAMVASEIETMGHAYAPDGKLKWERTVYGSTDTDSISLTISNGNTASLALIILARTQHKLNIAPEWKIESNSCTDEDLVSADSVIFKVIHFKNLAELKNRIIFGCDFNPINAHIGHNNTKPFYRIAPDNSTIEQELPTDTEIAEMNKVSKKLMKVIRGIVLQHNKPAE